MSSCQYCHKGWHEVLKVEELLEPGKFDITARCRGCQKERTFNNCHLSDLKLDDGGMSLSNSDTLFLTAVLKAKRILP